MLSFTVIAILIQIPAIQTKIVKYAASFISNKSHTRVEIKKIKISFPKSVVIEGIFLEDLKNDTLLYAGEVMVNIAFKDLFRHQIHIKSVSLKEVNLNLNRGETDSLFNFNFLITAFSDTIKPKKVQAKKKSEWTFCIDKVLLENIRFQFNDDYGGTSVAVSVKQLKLKMKKLDIKSLTINVDELFADRAKTIVLIKKSGKPGGKKSEAVLPTITVRRLQLVSANFIYRNTVNNQSIYTGVSGLKLKDASVDLPNQAITLEHLYLLKSGFTYNTCSRDTSSVKKVEVTDKVVKNNWTVSVKHIDIDDNSFSYMVTDKPKIKNAFDVYHLDYKHITLSAKATYYSSSKIEASINRFSAVDQNNFTVTKFETDFSMDHHSIAAKKLKLKTRNSSIDANLSIEYSSLKSLKDSIRYMTIYAVMKKVSVMNSDIIYFVPGLIKQAFFKNVTIISTVSGTVNGALNNLRGKGLIIKTGSNTLLKTDFIAVGLPSVKTAYFNFPNLSISSGRKDITMIAGSSIPKSIELPETISLQVVFKGRLKSFESTVGMSSSFGSANIFATIDTSENFNSKVSVLNFDLGSLLKNKAMFGTVSLTAETKGHGLNLKTIRAKITADISEFTLKKYTYHGLNADGDIAGQSFSGIINLNDENASFDFDGFASLNPNEEQYKFSLKLHGANLQKLNLTEEDIRIALITESDMKGRSLSEINGKVKISSIIVVHDGGKYTLDSILLTSKNTPGKSELNVSSALVDVKYTGNASPFSLPKEIIKFINHYFPFSDTSHQNTEIKPLAFDVIVRVHNHPLISEVLIPQLKEFEPVVLHGSLDSTGNKLKLNASARKIDYGTTEINDLVLEANSDENALSYKVSCSSVANSLVKLENILIDGKLSDKTLFAGISSIDSKQNKKLIIRAQMVKDGNNYKVMLDPEGFYLMNDRWNIAEDNYFAFGKQGFLIHHLFIGKTESQIRVTSVNDQFNGDQSIEVKKFRLSDVSRILEKDTGLLKGNVDGTALLKRVNNSYGLIADINMSNLFVRNIPIGNLTVKAENPTTEKFNIDVNLSGTDNNLMAKGYFIPDGGDNSLNIEGTIRSLSLKSAEAFSMGAITEASGNLTGNFSVKGSLAAPDITGVLVFNNAFITPAFLNNPLELIHETVQLKTDGIYFNSFTVLDAGKHKAVIDGIVKMKRFKDFGFSMHINTKDFLLFNSTAKSNKEFYGKMIIDSKIDIGGPLKLPVVNAKIKMKKGSNFTFAVPEKKLSTDKGEDVVKFEDTLKLNPILFGNDKKEKQEFSLTGFDISSIIEVDKEATLRLLLDPASSDSLVVKGEAALSFAIDRSGKMSLTGTYNLNDGNYVVSLESVIKRKFVIQPGGTIIWNGEILEAEISINAVYSVRASPIDLIAGQISGLSNADKNMYKQPYPFLVVLKLRGALLHPEISFEIQLHPEDKGILGGAVNAKLNMLNEDPNTLNKQVFALLVLGRFIQENPLQSESGGSVTSVVRSTVGTFLSAQLNQLSSKFLTGVELNFNIQSYDDYQTGQAAGRTQIDIGVKKQLFNERLSVQVGGSVDVEGEYAKKNSASDIISDVTIEYKLTKDGRYRLKAFRHNQYEGAIEGQLVETGAGVLYERDFNKWKELLKWLKKDKK